MHPFVHSFTPAGGLYHRPIYSMVTGEFRCLVIVPRFVFATVFDNLGIFIIFAGTGRKFSSVWVLCAYDADGYWGSGDGRRNLFLPLIFLFFFMAIG